MPVDRLPTGGPIRGGVVWVRFLVHLPTLAGESAPGESGVCFTLPGKPAWTTGVRNLTPDGPSMFVAGSAQPQAIRLPTDPTAAFCVLARLEWEGEFLAGVQSWLNPRIAEGRFASDLATPRQSLGELKLKELKELSFQFFATGRKQAPRLPGLGSVAVGTSLQDLMPGLSNPAGIER